MKAVDWDRN